MGILTPGGGTLINVISMGPLRQIKTAHRNFQTFEDGDINNSLVIGNSHVKRVFQQDMEFQQIS